ncbi:HhH-GDP family DNA glycosylase [Microlunatus antarcticus]|uniref:Endonuclease III n=1 Tax=Microlunatus antarcticus TaxID=53388 RepID=A0A7W5JTM9_9ACTN|nr:DNA methylase [Microlunatus antarcticus]MBB3326130.1 endonuclease III [Microlunatus antarcticus]
MTDDKDRTDAADLGLDLGGNDDAVLFRWLVACLLFGARISQDRAAAAFAELDGDGVLTPDALAGASTRHLVALLDAGRYTRFDDSKAAELKQLGRDVRERYDGRLSSLPEGARTSKEVSERLQGFKGIGPVAADIFLRDAPAAWHP